MSYIGCSSQEDVCSALDIVKGNLKEKDRKFADSLLDSRFRYGKLSAKQFYWAKVLVDRGMGKDDEKRVSVGDFSGVYSLFEKAAVHLKYPKINLSVNGHPVVLYRNGPRSKHPGEISVTDGGSYGSNRYYGRVSAKGEWVVGRHGFPELSEVESLLKRLSAAPEEVASEHGRLHGRCCFCHLPLSDEKSTAVGYGPVCAEHYGLGHEWKAAAGVLKEAA